MAVVQLRVDPHGRTYSTLTGVPEATAETRASGEEDNSPKPPGAMGELKFVPGRATEIGEDVHSENSDNGVVLPLSRKHVEMFTKMSAPSFKTTIRTDTVSTTLEQDTEGDFDNYDDSGKLNYMFSICVEMHKNWFQKNLQNTDLI